MFVHSHKRFSLLVILLLLFPILSGCSTSSLTEKIFGKAKAVSDLPADAVKLDGPSIAQTTEALIGSAQSNIYVEQHEIDRADLMDMLINKAKQGVTVKVIIDQAGINAKSTYDFLRSNGVDVRYYPTQQGQFINAQLLSIDGSKALIGGNVWSDNAVNNHAAAIELDGYSAWKAAWVFGQDWKFATTILPQLAPTSLPNDNIILATDSNIETEVLQQVQNSKKTIRIEIPQLTYPTELINAIADFAAGGKEVQVILDASHAQSESTVINKLASSGVQVRLYPTSPNTSLNANFALFDGASTILGSAMWTHSAFVQNHELDVLVPSVAVTQRLAEVFSTDWQKSQPVSLKNASVK